MMHVEGYRAPPGPCAKCGSRSHVERECFMNAPKFANTSQLGEVKINMPHRQHDAHIVREALEAAANAEPDRRVSEAIITVARESHTETLAYIRRLLKG